MSLAKPAGRNGDPDADREAALGYRLSGIISYLFVLTDNGIVARPCPVVSSFEFSPGSNHLLLADVGPDFV